MIIEDRHCFITIVIINPNSIVKDVIIQYKKYKIIGASNLDRIYYLTINLQ